MKDFTVIITGLNEGKEVRSTIESIRSTTNDVNIMFVDDGSDDGYDYSGTCKEFSCKYIRNESRMGVSESRNLGVSKCDTEYFVIIDAHMRFFDKDWDLMVLDTLKKYPKSIVCSKTAIMRLKDDGTIEGEDGSKKVANAYGAHLDKGRAGFEFSTVWSYKYIGERDTNTVMVPCVLGAFYATNKSWWNHIGGINGLIKWGSDEAIMSLKTWLAGGECLCFKDFYVGHLYRPVNPNPTDRKEIERNELYVANFFLRDKEKIFEFEESMKKRLGNDRFLQVKEIFEKTSDGIEKDRENFYNDVAVTDLYYFDAINKMTM